MSRLKRLAVYCHSLAGPAVIAALCAREHSKLTSLALTIGELDDAEDLSVLQGLRLETGELFFWRLDGCVQAAYPRPYVDAIARIAQASADGIHNLVIYDTEHVPQFFKDVDLFSKLRYLYIRDQDILALPCVFVERMAQLSIRCQGDSLDPDIASSLVDCFGGIEILRLVFDTTPLDVSRHPLYVIVNLTVVI